MLKCIQQRNSAQISVVQTDSKPMHMKANDTLYTSQISVVCAVVETRSKFDISNILFCKEREAYTF
jgi:hypothetical protein